MLLFTPKCEVFCNTKKNPQQVGRLAVGFLFFDPEGKLEKPPRSVIPAVKTAEKALFLLCRAEINS